MKQSQAGVVERIAADVEEVMDSGLYGFPVDYCIAELFAAVAG